MQPDRGIGGNARHEELRDIVRFAQLADRKPVEVPLVVGEILQVAFLEIRVGYINGGKQRQLGLIDRLVGNGDQGGNGQRVDRVRMGNQLEPVPVHDLYRHRACWERRGGGDLTLQDVFELCP